MVSRAGLSWGGASSLFCDTLRPPPIPRETPEFPNRCRLFGTQLGADRVADRAVQTDGMGDGMRTFGVIRVVWRAERAFRKRVGTASASTPHCFTAGRPLHCRTGRTADDRAQQSTLLAVEMHKIRRPAATFRPCRMRCAAAAPWPSGLEVGFGSRRYGRSRQVDPVDPDADFPSFVMPDWRGVKTDWRVGSPQTGDELRQTGDELGQTGDVLVAQTVSCRHRRLVATTIRPWRRTSGGSSPEEVSVHVRRRLFHSCSRAAARTRRRCTPTLLRWQAALPSRTGREGAREADV